MIRNLSTPKILALDRHELDVPSVEPALVMVIRYGLLSLFGDTRESTENRYVRAPTDQRSAHDCPPWR